jgi:hypothetical protein
MTDWAALAAEVLAPKEGVADERRAFPRTSAPKGARATLRTRHDRDALPIQLIDLSATGAGMLLPHRVTTNEFGILEIRWNGKCQPILVRLAHCSAAPEASGAGLYFVGVEFEEEQPAGDGLGGAVPESWLNRMGTVG